MNIRVIEARAKMLELPLLVWSSTFFFVLSWGLKWFVFAVPPPYPPIREGEFWMP